MVGGRFKIMLFILCKKGINISAEIHLSPCDLAVCGAGQRT